MQGPLSKDQQQQQQQQERQQQQQQQLWNLQQQQQLLRPAPLSHWRAHPDSPELRAAAAGAGERAESLEELCRAAASEQLWLVSLSPNCEWSGGARAALRAADPSGARVEAREAGAAFRRRACLSGWWT